jgi:ABC-2 type transport system permease protein
MFPVVFISTAFVPAELMPAWMRSVNTWNPVTYQIEAIRGLMSVGYDWSAIGQAVLADVIVGAVLIAGTLLAFRRLAA